MYRFCLFLSLSMLRVAAMATILLLMRAKEGYGQRVYADVQQSSPTQTVPILGTILSQVTNQNAPIDSDTSNFSTLSVTLGALGAITANQNLQFVNNPKPTNYSPVIIKFGSTSSLLNLLGGFSVQRTNGGRTSLVSPAYSGTQLLNLLNLLESQQTATAIIPPNGLAFDGVRLEINTTLGGLLTAYYHYAFYITPPQLSHSIIPVCEGEMGIITITNFQSGYTYRLYDAQTGGNEITVTATSAVSVSSSLDPGNYWLEARENDFYPSARTPVTVAIHPKPIAPTIITQ